MLVVPMKFSNSTWFIGETAKCEGMYSQLFLLHTGLDVRNKLPSKYLHCKRS